MALTQPQDREREALELAEDEEVIEGTFAGLSIFTVQREGHQEAVKMAVCKGTTLAADTVGELVEKYGQHMQQESDSHE